MNTLKAQQNNHSEGRQVINIDKDWQFHKGPLNQKAAADMNSASWEKVDIPHDWRIQEAYSKTNPRKNGYLPMGMGWYKKHLDIKRVAKGSKVFIEFGGVFKNTTVWINGQKAGTHLSGYTGFVLDITDYLDFGSQNNEMTVRVDNLHANPLIQPHPWSEYGAGHEGWWYEGVRDLQACPYDCHPTCPCSHLGDFCL